MGSVRIEQDGDVLVLRRRAGSLVAGGFLLLWLSAWTYGCAKLSIHVIRQPTLEHLLGGIPFWASWAFMACWLTWLLFGREWMRVGPDGLDYRSRAIIILRHQHVPLREVTGIAFYSKVVDSDSGRTEHGFRVETPGRAIRFGQVVNVAERTRLANLLQKHLQRLSPERPIPILKDASALGVEILAPSEVHEPPSDTRFRVHRDWNRTEFVGRGTFSLSTLGMLTLLNLFWNSIVGGLVFHAIKDRAWWPLVFLSFHGLVGVGMFLAWLATLFPPLAVRTLAIGTGAIGIGVSVFGIGRTRRYEPGRFVRVELRRGGRKPRFKFGVEGRDVDGESPYRLALIGRDGKDALTIDHLTEGEARWIGSEVARVLPKGQGPLPIGPEPLYDRWLDVR